MAHPGGGWGKWERTEQMNFRPLFFSAGCGDPCGTKGVLAYSRNLGEKHRKWVERKRRKTQIRSRMASLGSCFFLRRMETCCFTCWNVLVVGIYMKMQMYIFDYMIYVHMCFKYKCWLFEKYFCMMYHNTGTLFWKAIFPLKKMRGGPSQCFL